MNSVLRVSLNSVLRVRMNPVLRVSLNPVLRVSMNSVLRVKKTIHSYWLRVASIDDLIGSSVALDYSYIWPFYL